MIVRFSIAMELFSSCFAPSDAQRLFLYPNNQSVRMASVFVGRQGALR